MGNLYERYETDKEAMKEGVWVNFPDGVRVLIVSSQTDDIRRWEQKEIKKYRQAIIANSGMTPPEVSDAIEIQKASRKVVKAWENVDDKEGKPIVLNTFNAIKVFTDLPDFRKEVLYFSDSSETYRVAELEAIVGNSQQLLTPSSAQED